MDSRDTDATYVKTVNVMQKDSAKRPVSATSPTPSPRLKKQANKNASPQWDGFLPQPQIPILISAANDETAYTTPFRPVVLHDMDEGTVNTYVPSRPQPRARKMLDQNYEKSCSQSQTSPPPSPPPSQPPLQPSSPPPHNNDTEDNETAPLSSFGMPEVPSPYSQHTIYATSTTNCPNMNSEPVWVNKLFEKIDSINATVCHTQERVAVLESDIRALHELNIRVSDMEENLEFINNDYDAIKSELKQTNKAFSELSRVCQENSKQLRLTKLKLVDMEDRMKRDNLTFTNIPEQRNENPEMVVKNIIREKMGVKENIGFERVHRTGNFDHTDGRPRMMVAKFSYFKDRELVRRNARNLRGTRIGVYEHFSKATNEKRRILKPELEKARKEGKYAQLRQDHLIIDNMKICVDENGELYQDQAYDRPPPPQRRDRTFNNKDSTGRNYSVQPNQLTNYKDQNKMFGRQNSRNSNNNYSRSNSERMTFINRRDDRHYDRRANDNSTHRDSAYQHGRDRRDSSHNHSHQYRY